MPRIAAQGLPRIGNLGFAVDVDCARSLTVAVLGLSAVPINFPISSCRLLVLPSWIEFPATSIDANGFARTPAPVPGDPLLIGGRIYGQYSVVDPQGLLFGLASMSNGIEMTVGIRCARRRN